MVPISAGENEKGAEADNSWLNMTPWWFGWVFIKETKKKTPQRHLTGLPEAKADLCVCKSHALHWFLHVSVFMLSIHTHTRNMTTLGGTDQQRERMRVVLLEPSVSVFGNLIL